MFQKEKYNALCTIFLFEAAKRYKIGILSYSVQANHIHIVAQLPRGMTDSKALQYFKGYISRLMFIEAPEFELRYPRHELWSDGNFSTTVGFANLQETISYVKNQDEHHKLYLN